jgi:hypothetical protein
MVEQLARKADVQAIFLQGSYARGCARPDSDVDLLVVRNKRPASVQYPQVNGIVFDICQGGLAELRALMLDDGIVAHRGLVLYQLWGGAEWLPQVAAIARQAYDSHVPGVQARQQMGETIRYLANRIRSTAHPVEQSVLGADLVWQSAKVCLALTGIGPLRESEWHAALSAAGLPFDAAAAFATWYVGTTVTERISAALTLAEYAVGAPIAFQRISAPGHTPTLVPGKPLSVASLAHHQRMVLYGLDHLATAAHSGSMLAQALELGVITWFAVPACLALTGLNCSEHQLWWRVLGQFRLPFDAANLYHQTLIAATVAKRIASAAAFGQRTLAALENAQAQLEGQSGNQDAGLAYFAE